MDALSDVLKSVRLDGAVYLDAEFTAPWCVRGQYGQVSVRERLAGADHVVYFHFLMEGSCQVRLAEGGDALAVTTGDFVLFPSDDRHIIGSDLRLAPLAADRDAIPESAPGSGLLLMRHGGGGAVTRFVCGYLACHRSVIRPLLDALPRMLRIPIGDGPAAILLRDILRMAVRESSYARPGAGSTLAKLSELMFVEALRRHVESLPPDGRGWLAGVRDIHVGRALALLHEKPAKAWTVDQLARTVALSRSALAERFTALVGESPIQYLIRWRLALAAQSLRSGSEAVSRIAERCGYESAAAFSKAFKREFGRSPAAWRKAAA